MANPRIRKTAVFPAAEMANPEISVLAKTAIPLKKKIELIGLGFWAGFISGGISLAVWLTLSNLC